LKISVPGTGIIDFDESPADFLLALRRAKIVYNGMLGDIQTLNNLNLLEISPEVLQTLMSSGRILVRIWQNGLPEGEGREPTLVEFLTAFACHITNSGDIAAQKTIARLNTVAREKEERQTS